MPERGTTGILEKWRIVVLGAMLFLASAYFYQDPEWNGNSRLDLARAVVEQGTVAIDDYESAPQWETGDKAYFNGHYYSDKAIGSSLLAIPLYYVAYKLSAVLGIELVSAFTKHLLTTIVMGGAFTTAGLSMYWIAERVTGNAWKALVPTLALAFGTMLWPYSAVYYGHVPAAAFLILAFAILFSARGDASRLTAARLFTVGLAAGLAFITDYTAGLIVVGLIVFGIFALRREGPLGLLKAAGISICGAALPLGLALAYNWNVYGSAFATGYAYEVENRFAQGMSQGILGISRPNLTTLYHITLDPQFGILWQSPVLILAPVGYIVGLSAARYRAAALLSLYVPLAMLAMNAGYYLWWGGSAFGPRLLIPALPFLIVPLAILSDASTGWVGVLGLISAAQMLIPLLGQIQPTLLVYRLHRGTFYVNDQPFTGFSLLYDYDLPQIGRQYAAGRPAWTLGAAVGLPYLLSVPALIVAEFGLILGFRKFAFGGRATADLSEPQPAINPKRPSGA